MRRFRSLRFRLTALFIGIASVMVAVAAIGTDVLLEDAVWGPFDAMLGEEAETACSLYEAEALDNVRRAVEAIVHEPAPGPGKFVEVMRPDNTLLARAGRIPPALERELAQAIPGARTITLSGRKRPYRAVWYESGRGCRVAIGARADAQVRMLRNAGIAICGGAAVLLVVLGVLAWVITGRATVELGRLAAEVETIEAGSLERRLAPRRTLEVDSLAVVLNRLLERLDAAMTHLRRFTADAAHELRTPIAGLRARLEVSLGGPRSEGAYRDGLLDALEQTERLGGLAEHLLALSAVEAGTAAGPVERVRLDALAREVAESVEPLAQEQGRPFACDTPVAATIHGRPEFLKRVLLNLLDNAFRHTPGASAVRLAVDVDDGVARIEVHDQGPGIPADELPLVFDRFHRGGGAGTGGGLGLALCREIVAQHRGSIEVKSHPTTGTTVTVRLPT